MKSEQLVSDVLARAQTLDADQLEPFFNTMAVLCISVLRGIHSEEWLCDYLDAAKFDESLRITAHRIQ